MPSAKLRDIYGVRIVVANDSGLIALLKSLPNGTVGESAIVQNGREAIDKASLSQPDLVMVTEQMGFSGNSRNGGREQTNELMITPARLIWRHPCTDDLMEI